MNRRLDGVRARSGDRSPSANKTRRLEGLSQFSGGADEVDASDEDGVGLRARFLDGEGCFDEDLDLGVAALEPPSRKSSRVSSRSGRRSEIAGAGIVFLVRVAVCFSRAGAIAGINFVLEEVCRCGVVGEFMLVS